MNNYFSLINGEFTNSISVLDRGLSYGDGIFETMSWSFLKDKGQLGVEFWKRHLKRIEKSCLITKIKLPSTKLLNNFKAKILEKSFNSGITQGILKIIITRGIGGRGYKYESNMQPTIIFLSFPRVDLNYSLYSKGVRTRFCESLIFKNHQLAGLKHLNRLDSVMGRSEWNNKNFFEGILVDDKENIIEGTMTNIFFARGKMLFTPLINHSGIKGVMRQVIIEKSKKFFEKVEEVEIKKTNINSYNEMFITNSILKIMPVRQLEKKKFKISRDTKELIKYFSDDYKKRERLELL